MKYLNPLSSKSLLILINNPPNTKKKNMREINRGLLMSILLLIKRISLKSKILLKTNKIPPLKRLDIVGCSVVKIFSFDKKISQNNNGNKHKREIIRCL